MIVCANSLEYLKTLEANTIDACVCDPPYGLSFMGKKWDYDVPTVELWTEVLRVLKPGGFLLAFAGTRTQHRMAVNIEDAGFEIRDMIAWLYGSGFPKSHNIGKAINKIDGVEFQEVPASGVGFMNETDDGYNTTKNQLIQKGESSASALRFEGWGTALKPAMEMVSVARKPFKGTVAKNALLWGTGGINIDGCRVPGVLDGDPNRFNKTDDGQFATFPDFVPTVRTDGRFPANVILGYSENEYILKDELTDEQRKKVLDWLYENTKHRVQDVQETSISETQGIGDV